MSDTKLENRLDNLLKDFPNELRQSIKNLCIIMQNKGIAVGAYTISKHILDILYSEPNPAKAKAKAIQFIKQNNELRKKDGNSTEKTSKIIKFKKDVDNIESSD